MKLKLNPIKVVERFKDLEVVMASFLLLIPLILILASKEVRPSISDYAYSQIDYVFSGLLWCSAVMFIYNAVLTKKWYNGILGMSLIGVSLTPHLDFPILHYSFASIFFLGSVFVMIFFSSDKQRIYKIAVGTLIIAGLFLHFVFNMYSLLVAEWIGMAPICIHFIGESLNKID